jgi:hypothetical protein
VLVVMWVAQASLDGQPVGQVDDLVAQAQTTYPVAELKTVSQADSRLAQVWGGAAAARDRAALPCSACFGLASG